MHFIVWLLILLLIVLMTGLAVGIFYLTTSPGVGSIVVKSYTTVFSNGADTIWPNLLSPGPAFLLTDSSLRGFFADVEWFVTSPLMSLDAPFFFTLSGTPQTLKIFILKSANIFTPGINDDFIGEIQGNNVVLRFSNNGVPTNTYFTGHNVLLGTPQGFGIIIAYTV